MYAVAPNGLAIIGTLERLTARADVVQDGFTRRPDGKLEFDHAGYTEIFWESQETVELEGKTVFLDAHGNEWTHDQLTLSEEPPA
jgi:hypothetical protein